MKRPAIFAVTDGLSVLLSLLFVWMLLTDGRFLPGADVQVGSNLKDPHDYVEGKKIVRDLYSACEQEIRDALPGLVCWGDKAAVGSKYGSLSASLYRLMNSALASDPECVPGMVLKIRVLNMGVEKEGMREILARCGASRLLLAEDYTIPSYGYMSNVSLMDEEGNELRFAQQPYAKFDTVSIQDVNGYLYVGFGTYDSEHPHLAFSKGIMGRGVPVSAGTPVEVESAAAYRELLPILYFDSALGLNEDELIQSLSRIVAHQENPGGYYAVIVRAEERSPLDEALNAAFGERYIRAEKLAAEMREADYSQLAERVYACLDQQGAFDAVREIMRETAARMEESTASDGGNHS